MDPGEGLPWDQRDSTFLCIGRFHPTKRLEVAIEIVGRVRARVLADAKLILVGSPVDDRYADKVRALAAATGRWIEFKQDLSRAEVNALIGRSRFGIHAMVGEHFGMATAEMARAGCLVFAHNSCGSPEVLNHDAALLWGTVDEAVARIAAVVASTRAGEISRALRAYTERFSTGAFSAGIRRLVESRP